MVRDLAADSLSAELEAESLLSVTQQSATIAPGEGASHLAGIGSRAASRR